MSPVLSVIIPVYNSELYLKRCVDSLCMQTMHNLEVILVDDGSTDASGAICDEMAGHDGRIKVIHKKNEGQGIARNCGLTVAAGKYVAFVDSDDYMEQDAYEYVLEKMEQADAQLICFGYLKEDEEGHVVSAPTVRDAEYEGVQVSKEFVPHFFGDDPKDDNLRGVSACMSVYRLDMIKEHKVCFASERKVFSEDTIFNLDYCKHVQKVVACSRILYHYRLHETSFTKGYQRDRFDLTVHFAEILNQYAEAYQIEKEVGKRIRQNLWISLMDSVKQEVYLLNQTSHAEVKKRVQNLCEKESVQKLLQELNMSDLGKKQRIFCKCMKRKKYDGLIILAYIRNRRGL